MRLRPLLWLLLSVSCFIGAVYFWRLGNEWQTRKAATARPATATSATKPQSSVRALSTSPMALLPLTSTNSAPATNANSRLKYRLSNTSKTPSQLARQEHALLLANALIDTTQPLNLAIPDSLKAKTEPGAYLVQSRTVVDDRFRGEVRGSGANIVAYFPNNAFLVSASADVAAQLNTLPGVQIVIPWEPYYKLDSRLLAMAVEQEPLPPESTLNLVVFPDARENTLAALEQLGVTVAKEARSPFGPILTVTPSPGSLTALAGLPGVQTIEIASRRAPANDLSRAKVGVAISSVAPTNYQALSGSKVLVAVVDTAVDPTHPDLSGRVFGPAAGNDLLGHGTHVAGTIAGNGSQSLTVSNASGSVMPPVGGQFRGMATNATIFSLDYRAPSDFELQETAARTNALISNNSWTYATSDYDIAAASYDAAVRDSLPDTMGSQPVVYVFAAGNAGNGTDSGTGISENSILSPATAKNVITVGAIEQIRNITNSIEIVLDGVTNSSQPWLGMTDSDSEVASFSSRGNVGVNLEGDFGRFKPDVVAPGTFVVSTKSPSFDPVAYFDPTYVHSQSFLDIVDTNSVDARRIRIPFNAIQLTIDATAIYPDVDMPIYLNRSTLAPKVTDAPVGTNTYSTTDMTPRDALWTVGIGNVTNVAVQYRLDTSVYTTNDMGNFFEVLSNMNSQLGPFYRYESGTSMAAADVSGVLALMEDYFTNKLGIIPSPALMKAMLINGARTANAQYDLEVRKPLNDQGWGLVNLTNSLPIGLANQAVQGAMLFFDQNPTNAVATGDRRTFNIQVAPSAVNQPLRITLVWTDPPGNPAAGVKLVNDLDLIVTNLDNKTLYYVGNDIPVGSSFTFPAETNAALKLDFVNNVENVYISQPLSTNYSITVIGHRVNVNAVTAHPNNVVQDYALVVSSGNGETNTAITITAGASTVNNNQINTTIVTNDFGSNTNISGQLLLGQHVGANSPLVGQVAVPLGSNTIWGVGGTNGMITLGETNQWHFYIMTNSTSFTNAAFATFLPPTLSMPRMGVTNYNQPDNATRVQADIDMYVSSNPGLLNLDPNVIATADKSTSRGGTEVVAFSNSVPGQVYYIGIQSQDQQAAEYAFFGVFSLYPFSTTDENGVETVRGINVPSPIPEGTPKNPGGVIVVGLALQPIEIRRVVVTNTLSHDDIGNLFGALTHNELTTVLNNHSCVKVPATLNCYTNYTYIYEDNGEGDIPDSQHTDGPGDLRGFVGDRGEGVWLLTEVDNVGGSTGQVDSVFIRLDPAFLADGSVVLNVQPFSFAFTSVLVPPEATNLTICVQNESSTQLLPVELYVRRGDFPTLTDYDFKKRIDPPGGCLTISTNDFPPLQPGRYYIGIFNPNSISQTVRITVTMGLGASGVDPIRYTSAAPLPILDDAVTYSSIFVTNDSPIVRAEAGVVIQHPRVSDLALTLVSPSGKRILLDENRGGTSTNGMGSVTTTTNTFPVRSGNITATDTNALNPVPISGTLIIDYNFFAATNTMDVYNDGISILSTGALTGGGTRTVDYGPGSGTNLVIVINQNPDTNSTPQWTYVPRIISRQFSYFIFSENTNFAKIPIKFARPPFVNGTNNSIGVATGWSQWAVAAGGNDHWYKAVSTSGVSWNQASGIALNAGGYLATVTSSNENAFVFSLVNSGTFFASFNGSGPALGGIKTNTVPGPVSGWTWTTGEPWIYTNWFPGQPDSPNSEFRLHYFSSLANTPDSRWNDIAPNDLNLGGYVIEHEPVILSTNFYFPEEPLKTLVGDNAYGLWKLEMWDSRVGATNPAPQLVSWQLRFILENTTPAVTPLSDGIPVTNTVPPCATAYFSVQVPSYVGYVTNRLLFATPPGVNVYFNQTNLPASGGTNAGDVGLITGPSTGGSFLLFTNNIGTNSSVSTPPLIPGSRYYLAVENPCGSGTNVTFAIQVDFAVDAIVLTNMIPYSNTNSGATNGNDQLYVYNVSTNAARVQFEIIGPTGDMTLVARRGLPPPSELSFDYNSVNPTTNGELIVVITNSVPVALAPGNWYLDAINVSGSGVAYSIMASEWPVTGRPFSITNAVLGTNSFCLTWTSLPLVHYYVEGKQTLGDPGWYKATYTLTASADSMDWCIDLPSPFQFFRVTEGLSLFDVPEPPPVATVTVVTNGVALNWVDSITGRYEVQWTPTLVPPSWTSFTNTITSTNGWFSFVDDGTQTNGSGGTRFYRVRQLLPP